MSGSAIMTEIITILTSGISGIATGVGTGVSTLAQAVFLTGEGNSQTLSVFGILVIVFAGISLAIGLCKFIINMITSFGN